MEKDESFSVSDQPMATNFSGIHHDYSLPQSSHRHHLPPPQLPSHHPYHQDQFMKSRFIETSSEINGNGMFSYFLNNNNPNQYHHHHHHHHQSQLQQFASLDKLSFAEVMQFADFGPKLSLNGQNNKLVPDDDENNNDDDSAGIDPVYFLKFPVLNDRSSAEETTVALLQDGDINEMGGAVGEKGSFPGDDGGEGGRISEQIGTTTLVGEEDDDDDEDRIMKNNDNNKNKNNGNNSNWVELGKNNKRKRGRTVKTNEEVESQRMTHIAVERNRRKQMNEHLRVLRSLMPGSYVQRGDQASIIGGAIEFVRELEQLLQCLESQKRRRLLGESGNNGMGSADSSSHHQPPPPQPPTYLPPPGAVINDNSSQMKMIELELEHQAAMTTTGAGGLIHEETAESKSCLADVEVKLLGFDAMIKILSRRRPGQLIKAIAALEDLQLNILHTNITTIEQTVLYSFNVKVASESRFTADDIASSVQQIFGFIHANSAL